MVQQNIINLMLMIVSLFVIWILFRIYYSERSNFRLQKKILEEKYQIQQDSLEQLQKKILLREEELLRLHGEYSNAKACLQQLEYWKEEYKNISHELRNQIDINKSQEAELREVTTRLEETRIAEEEKQRLLISSEQRLSIHFENLANKIFENNGRRIEEQNRQNINYMIGPLREQLDGFSRQLNDSFNQESRERFTLTHEIRQLQQLNTQIAQEAINLTKALKGDNKIQGNWGEVVLSRVLESSGLRKGYEYETQVSIPLETQGRVQPDVIVRLPQGKDVIIDAKMTLVAYERYFNTEDEIIREKAIQDHLNAIRNHIKNLGQKDYQQLPGIRSLDYVLMFISIEPAFLLAIDRQPELISEALQYNIMLVSPTTLFIALRTINNLWRYENQSRNAQRIADRAARLYDKMRLFIDDMIAVGNNLDKSQQSYNLAMKKLVKGRSNLIAQSESFRSLGVEVKKPINPQLVEQAQIKNVDIDNNKDNENDDELNKKNISDNYIDNLTISPLCAINENK